MNSNEISILFVEDSETIRNLISKFLYSLEFKNVYIAKDGREGLQKYKEHKPDIILTDLTMPLMNGLEMSKKIKKIDEKIPIILITSHFEKEITEAAIDIGIDAYLFKPLSLQRVEKILNKYIERILFQREFAHEHKLLEQYKIAIDAGASVSKTDTKGVITYVNDSFCKMSGYSKEELIGSMHSIVKHPETPTKTHKELWNTITNKKIWQGRIKNLKKNGETYYKYSVIVPIVDAQDTINEYIALQQDVTDLFHKKSSLNKEYKRKLKKISSFIKREKKRSS